MHTSEGKSKGGEAIHVEDNDGSRSVVLCYQSLLWLLTVYDDEYCTGFHDRTAKDIYR